MKKDVFSIHEQADPLRELAGVVFRLEFDAGKNGRIVGIRFGVVIQFRADIVEEGKIAAHSGIALGQPFGASKEVSVVGICSGRYPCRRS